jgi:hypothetical protein
MKKYPALLLALLPTIVWAADKGKCDFAPGIQGKPGVLVKCIPDNAGFFTYIDLVLTQNRSYIIAGAVIIVVFSGLQYILALGNAAEQTKAKQRITGIVIGVIFFTLIRFILSLLAPGLNP